MQNLSSGSEKIEVLAQSEDMRVERIISNNAASPDGFWYDQDENEKVWVLQGEAEIEFENEIKFLKSGDAIEIPKHVRHRVKSTSKNCVWLAIFLK